MATELSRFLWKISFYPFFISNLLLLPIISLSLSLSKQQFFTWESSLFYFYCWVIIIIITIIILLWVCRHGRRNSSGSWCIGFQRMLLSGMEKSVCSSVGIFCRDWWSSLWLWYRHDEILICFLYQLSLYFSTSLNLSPYPSSFPCFCYRHMKISLALVHFNALFLFLRPFFVTACLQELFQGPCFTLEMTLRQLVRELFCRWEWD